MSTLNIAIGSVLVGLTVLAIKFVAWYITGSVALFSDALESIINVATSSAALIAVRLSARPADANHPYGHYKAEYFSAVVEGVLIVVAAVSIFREAYFDFLSPHLIEEPLGLAVSAGASVINAGWAALLVRQGRLRRSPALVADGQHLFTDVLSSVGVVVGLGLSILTGWAILDPILAAGVAFVILWSGWHLVRESVGGLMDEAVPGDLLDKIRSVISENAAGALEAHDLRTRHAGRMTFIDFHLVVPGSMSVTDAHAICDEIEKALKVEVPGALVTIHVEPEEKAKHHGVVVL
jgi:cation diffusion facilitator family transporter